MNVSKTKLITSLSLNALIGLAIPGLTACNGGSETSSASNNTATPSSVKTNLNIAKDSLYLMRMGSGVDSVSKTATSGQTCLANAPNHDNIDIGNPSPLINFDHAVGMIALQTALNVDVSSQYGGDRFGGSLSAQFANASKDTKYTTNLLYLNEYAGQALFKDGSLGQGLAALTPYAASLAGDNPTDFRALCGDEFVEQMDAGVVLGVKLALNFNSHTDQERFIANMKGDVGLANVSAAIQQAAASANVHVEMTLSAIQQGGQPEKLNELFGEPDSSGNYAFLQCNSQNAQQGSTACDLMISNIISYAQTLGQQLTNSDGSLNLNSLYYTNPTLTPYSHLGITMQGAPDPSAEILAAMAQLTSEYDKAVYDYNFASHYITFLSGKLDSSTKENLRDAAQRLNNQINNVFLLPSYDVADCYKGYVSNKCLTIRDNVEHALTKYALNTVETNLIAYLEANSYNGFLMSYYGGATPTSADYRFSGSECIFAPVSNPNDALYAINCDGKWLSTVKQSGVTLLPGSTGQGISTLNLAYYSSPSTTNENAQLITYKDLTLPVDSFDPNRYVSHTADVFAPGFSACTDLTLMRLYENQA